MQIISTPDLVSRLSSAQLLVDTSTLIDMSKNHEFQEIIFGYVDNGCTLATVPPVQAEFLSVADTVEEQKVLADFLKSCGLLYTADIERKLFTRDFSSFMIALRRSKVKDPSYVDTLLLFAPYFYSRSLDDIYVMTANHKDVPLEFYDRVGIIVCDNGKVLHSEGIYKFNLENFRKVIA